MDGGGAVQASMHRCPACASERVRGGKTDLPEGTLYEFGCQRCGRLESCLDTRREFDAWFQRWQAPRPAT